MAWADVGQSTNNSSSGASDLIKIEDKKRIRLLLPDSGPVSNWIYSVSTPADGYRTWVSPDKEAGEDFFAVNRNIFNLKPVHAGHAYDYEESRIKILEAGNQIWEGIKILIDAGKDLNNRDIIIIKTGTGRSTEYKVTDCDPTPAPAGLDTMERPDIMSRYQAPTYEVVIEDLRMLGFTQPEQIFALKPLDYQTALQTKIPFGKWKNKTMQEVVSLDSQYITFLATKIDRLDIKECARVISNTIMGTDFPMSGVAPEMSEVTFVAPTEGQSDAPVSQSQVPTTSNTPPAPPPPAPAPDTPTASNTRDLMIAQINEIFETQPIYHDFMKIISAMKEASAPNNKTSVGEFTDIELQKLLQIISTDDIPF